ncbi:hypothetical protein DACRYDRAFT_45876 [Dacryopinax primogenitus]|uniref:tRNA-splicing endonuclease subunit Sen34 n=1 Tax=Dacryopinax primogenitus (strain DJM 731) TaxID=1858805 RepID=M5G5D9_DACPD|nr:uncharacterized protein DACRYDRAFT_45876 [Dacryopinax primogenitus]EJU05471.1 hypothetical protein DACRYDRAFT_45876 [Dacryopinax primogenitus]
MTTTTSTSVLTSTSIPPIPIYISNNQGLIWTIQDLAFLRTKHICSALVGTLPSATQQNVFLGLPGRLMPEEVVLLVDLGLAYLVDDPSSYPSPTRGQLEQWEDARQDDVGLQQEKKEEKERRPKRVLQGEALRKREERARRGLEGVKGKEGGEEVLQLGEEEDGEERRPPGAKEQPAPTLPNKSPPHWVSIPSSSFSLPWYAPHLHCTLHSALKANIFNYPSTPLERAKSASFRALWQAGYFLGSGLKFGGDWLVYPGDPLRYHSHFVASARGMRDPLHPMEIIAFGRLGTATKKAHLLCAWEESTGDVEFFSVEWANFG